MKAFTYHVGVVVPLDRANIDTDGILPKQFMKSIERTGFGEYLFDEWRYLDHGEPGMDCSKRKLNPDFPLNQERYKGASILVTRENFGCGSSREHAPWALRDFGIKVIISPSFASIFYGNCLKNGLLPITLKEKEIDELFYMVDKEVGYSLSIDLSDQTVKMSENKTILFDIDATIKRNLQLGLDDIALTLKHYDNIKKYEKNRNKQEPWLNILSSL